MQNNTTTKPLNQNKMKEEDKQYLSQVGMYLADLFYNQKNINMKQTAVEWFVEQLSSYTTTDGNIISHHQNITHFFEQAKAMEKEQQQKIGIIMAIFAEEVGDKKCIELLNKADQYYNETFKSE